MNDHIPSLTTQGPPCMNSSRAAHPHRPKRRTGLTVGAGLVAMSAYAGAVGLTTGIDPYLRHLTNRLPFHSPEFGAAALTGAVAVPHTCLAWRAWQGDDRTNSTSMAAGALLFGWILVELSILREWSFLDPLYAGIGLTFFAIGYRGNHNRGKSHAHKVQYSSTTPI